MTEQTKGLQHLMCPGIPLVDEHVVRLGLDNAGALDRPHAGAEPVQLPLVRLGRVPVPAHIHTNII